MLHAGVINLDRRVHSHELEPTSRVGWQILYNECLNLIRLYRLLCPPPGFEIPGKPTYEVLEFLLELRNSIKDKQNKQYHLFLSEAVKSLGF